MDIKNCLINNGYDNLNIIQQNIRMLILNMMIDSQKSVSYDEVRQNGIRNGFSLDVINMTLEKFKEEQYFISDDSDNIMFMYPVSSHPTTNKVTLSDGRSFFAMCAVDALGCAVTFDQDIEINSSCYVTGRKINIKIKDGKFEYVNNEDLRVLHVNISKYTNWASSC